MTGTATGSTIDNPILNSPYEAPSRHFVLTAAGPTGEIKDGRRPSESFVPVPATKKGDDGQLSLDFETVADRVDRNDLVNEIRIAVDKWRANNYPGVTPYTRKLLLHWAPGDHRDDPVLFCQREAAETAIFLVEVAGRHGEDYRRRLEPVNKEHNQGLPRIALKMATGSGKTVVMAMLVAWQTINKVHSPRDSRFAKQFLIVAPGVTIRDRLRVLKPADDENYYDLRDLVPPDLRGELQQAQVVITNYHAFLKRDAKEIKGVASNTRRILTAGKKVDPFKETDDQMVARVLSGFAGKVKGEIVVFNDEAHHCYMDKPLDEGQKVDREDKDRNEEARVWFKGLQAVQKKVGIKTVFDLSATPFYLGGAGWTEGFIFPWVVSDFGLMDAIESGIVKVPRVPVDDDADSERVTYLHLWDAVGSELPKRANAAATNSDLWIPPAALEGALRSLYRSYEKSYRRWEDDLEPLGEPPPVMIVVCPNTVVSKLVFDWIAGAEVTDGERTVNRRGNLELFSNVDENGGWTHRPPTIIVDSAQLESGEAMNADFKKAAGKEIDTFKNELRLRGAHAQAENLTDEDILREVMNTVGKKGKLGETVRCVVSVSMLTEGWDANTVTHILGIRAFRSQLLCEQVVGRGLRRRSYAVNDDGKFEPEYADVYGVPFAFIPASGGSPDTPPKAPPVWVGALDERSDLEITFPKVEGYRLEIPDEQFIVDFDETSHLTVRKGDVATWVEAGGIIGKSDEVTVDELRGARPQQVAYQVARTLVATRYQHDEDDRRPWLFAQLVGICRQWLDECVTYEADTDVGLLLLAEGTNAAAEKVFHGIATLEGDRTEYLQPILRRFDPEGSSEDVSFATRKEVLPTTKSHVNHVVLDSGWEATVAQMLEDHSQVASYVKNDHLGFAIPYVHKGRAHDFVPDFLVRLVKSDPDDLDRTLIVEVSGGLKKAVKGGAELTAAKAATARTQWCPAVNHRGGFGRWGYTEITDMQSAKSVLTDAIASLYADGAVTGLATDLAVGED